MRRGSSLFAVAVCGVALCFASTIVAASDPSGADAAGETPRAQTAQCAWVGKRTVHVLLRDDLIAADGFLGFYEIFDCPVEHLGEAFGCVLGVGEDAAADAIEARVDTCWADPQGAAAPAIESPLDVLPMQDTAPADGAPPEEGMQEEN